MVEETEELEEDVVDDERPRKPWALIVLALVLAALAGWSVLQWKEASDRESQLKAEIKKVYAETEALRARAAQAQTKAQQLEQQVTSLSTEREALTQRVIKLEEELVKLRKPQRTPPPAKKPANATTAPKR